MGCSSSALNKAGDSSRFRSGVPSNENSSTGEQSKFCVAQPTPCTPGRETAFYSNAQRAGHAPSEKPKASVVPTANGVKSCHQPCLANDEAPGKDATDQSGTTKETEPVVRKEECEAPQPGCKDATLGPEEMKKDVETSAEAQTLKGNTETEPLGTEARNQPLRTPREGDSPGAGEHTEIPQTAGGMKVLETTEDAVPLETAKELLPPEEAMGPDTEPQIVEATIPRENSSPEVEEGCQPAEGGDEQQQPQQTACKNEQPQLLEIVLKENETPHTPDRSQLVQTPVMNESLCETPDGTRNAGESQPEATVGSREKQAGTAVETAANAKMAGEINTGKEEQHVEGETGEKMDAGMKSEEESEATEKETGEAVDVGAAEGGGRPASAHSTL
ncbi:glutamate-rich protein 5 [Phodopus roborovskii]|uniref:glutamate-rich protein 5 n=1 Tax=Phodopus roborovskii TaxID=109678 RepID=UPI0021E39A03|nr:glutamate-rich protein 5 [Phodopus roborovskii]